MIPESKKAERDNLKNPSSKRLKENSAPWSALDLTKHADLPKKQNEKKKQKKKTVQTDSQMISSVVDLTVNYYLTTKLSVIHS